MTFSAPSPAAAFVLSRPDAVKPQNYPTPIKSITSKCIFVMLNQLYLKLENKGKAKNLTFTF
jgi:hypothetical protein